MADDAPLVRMRGLSKTFPGQRALDGVDLDIRHGEIHALLGHNGSGKSTLIKLLAGFHTPDRGGSIEVHGKPLHLGSPRASHAAGLRFVHQDLGLIDELTVIENVALDTGYQRTPLRTIAWRRQLHRTMRLLDQLGVEIDPRRRIGDLPAVDRTMVAIARALDGIDTAGGLLVLDEPTAALSPDEVEQLFRVVRQLRRRGVSSLYVTHRMDEVADLTDTVTVLRDGVVRATGPTADHPLDALVRLIVGDQPVEPIALAAPPTDQQPALRVRGLRSTLLRGVDLDVRPGEAVGLAGVLGSGREEIGKALVGAVSARADEYATSAGAVASITPRETRRHGIVLAPGTRGRGSMIDDFTIAENLSLPVLGHLQRVGVLDKRREEATTVRWIDRFQVRPPRPEAALHALSGGNRQKVLIAKWMNTQPRVLISDEPTAGVDVGASAAIHSFVREAAKSGTACLVASSDNSDLVATCSRVLVLHRGRIVHELLGEEITEDGILRAMSAAGRSDTEAESRS